MNMIRSLGFVVSILVLAAGCGSSSPPIGKTCAINSECTNPLSCTFGRCHEACTKSSDCPAGQTCVKTGTAGLDGGMVNVCQLPVDVLCHYHSDCTRPLKCARDLHCRNECQDNVDCNDGQTCVAGEHVCADPPDLVGNMLKNAIDGSIPNVRPGVDADLPADNTDGGTGDAPGDGGVSDVPVGSSDGGGGTLDGPSTPIPVTGVMSDRAIVRQGELGVTVTVTATMGGLAGASGFDIGGCKATLQDGATDTMFVLRVSCSHGTALGAKNLTFQTSKGVGSYMNVFTVSPITSGPTGKDDNRGTSDQPFRTFKKALGVADKGDTIQLQDGMYDKDSGEDFKDLIPAGITILGQSATGTKLIGPSDTAIYVDGLRTKEAGDLTVKNLTLGFFRYGIYLDKPTNATFENVKVTRSRSQGVYVYSGAEGSKLIWTGDESEISDHGNQAVYIAAKGTVFSFKSKGPISSTYSYVFQAQADMLDLTLEGTTLGSTMANPQALGLYEGNMYQHNVTVNNVTFNGLVDIGGKDKTTAVITNSSFNLPVGSGGTSLDFTGGKLMLMKAKFTGGGTHLHVHSGEVTVRMSSFANYYYNGVTVSTAKKVDLGTEQPGANDFTPGTVNANSFAIYDQRPADMQPITVSETTVNGNAIPAGENKGPVSMPPRFHISTALNVIKVF
jgi:hypothetical protein